MSIFMQLNSQSVVFRTEIIAAHKITQAITSKMHSKNMGGKLIIQGSTLPTLDSS